MKPVSPREGEDNLSSSVYHIDTISKYLPQKYQLEIHKSVKEELPVVTLDKVSKAVKLLEEIGKEAKISPLAEAKRLEIAANIKTTQKTLLELNNIFLFNFSIIISFNNVFK